MCAATSAQAAPTPSPSTLGPSLACLPRACSRLVLAALFTCALVLALSTSHFAISNPPSPIDSSVASSSALPSAPATSVSLHHVSEQTQPSEDVHDQPPPKTADGQRIQEILATIYSQIRKQQHNSQPAALTSEAPAGTGLSQEQQHLIAERVQDMLRDVAINQKQPEPSLKSANFKKNGKTIQNAGEEISGKLVPSGAPDTGAHFAPQTVAAAQVSPDNQVPVQGTKLKLAPSFVATPAVGVEKHQRNEEQVPEQSSTKFLSSMSPRKVLTESMPSSAVQNPNPTLSASFVESNLFEMLASMDSRLQKLQDSMVYCRNAPKPSPLHSANSPLNPIFTNYLSMIKAQVHNIEAMMETKFSNIEHKFSNIEIEDSIWKKTINWKLDEMTSKLSQNENKLAFSNEQIMNKLDLFERNLQIVTNDFFAKFLLVNEKLNKIELSLQTKWNDLDTKVRTALLESYKPGNGKMPTSLFGYGGFATLDQAAQVQVQVQQEAPAPPAKAPASNPEVANRKEESKETTSNSSGASKLSWNKPSAIKANNGGNVTIADRLKFAQRFLKLINSKTNQTRLSGSKGSTFNSTYLEALMSTSNTATVGPMAQNDEPQMDAGVNSSASGDSPRTTDRPAAEENSTAKTEKPPAADYRKVEQNKGTTKQAMSMNHRNLDSIAGINYADFGAAQHRNAMDEANLAKCEHLLGVKRNALAGDDSSQQFATLCQQLLESNSSMNVPALALAGAFLRGSSPTTGNNQNQSMDGREAVLEKRHLNEEIVVDQSKDKEGMLGPMEETLSQFTNEIKTGTKLEELDSKLQFFSTKIIKIVQEMWHSSQASENYLKETLSVVNKTRAMMKEEFVKMQAQLKPVTHMNNIAEEIREPIINRLQELSTAINNSIEVIFNTQTGFINTCREDLQIYDVLNFIMHDIKNKSANGIQQLNREVHEQGSHLNRSIEFMLLKLDVVSKKTIDGVRSESVKLLDLVKSELRHITSTSGGGLGATFLAAHRTDIPKSVSSSGAQCTECFITRDEFANFCVREMPQPEEDTASLEPKPVLGHQDHQTENVEEDGEVHSTPQEPQPINPKIASANLEQFGNTNGTRSDGGGGSSATIEINNGNSEN